MSIVPETFGVISSADLALKPDDFLAGFPPADLVDATRAFLSTFVVAKAEQTAGRLGFGWEPREAAPSTYEQVVEAFAHSAESMKPFPVWNGASSDSILTSPEANFALRFWHDTLHAERGKSFEALDEIDMGMFQLSELEDIGIERGTIAWRLLEADSIGQTLCVTVLGSFPVDQKAFDLDCMVFGIHDALLIERERRNAELSGV